VRCRVDARWSGRPALGTWSVLAAAGRVEDLAIDRASVADALKVKVDRRGLERGRLQVQSFEGRSRRIAAPSATKKKSPAQLQREIDEVLAKLSGSARDQQLAEAIDSGSRKRAAEQVVRDANSYGVFQQGLSAQRRARR
jgi:hypothetical protein